MEKDVSSYIFQKANQGNKSILQFRARAAPPHICNNNLTNITETHKTNKHNHMIATSNEGIFTKTTKKKKKSKLGTNQLKWQGDF